MAMKHTSFDYKHLSYLLHIEQEMRAIEREKKEAAPEIQAPS
jgi:hypothetical protein